MEDLPSLVRGYLEAEGYEVRARGRDLLIGRRAGRGDEQDRIYVWVPADMGRTSEGPYLRRFQEATEEHPTATKYFLVRTTEGLTREFRDGARQWHGVRITVPAQFFDRNFRWESDRRANTATSALKQRGEDVGRWRIAQPFRVLRSPRPDGNGQGSDLLDALVEQLQKPSGGDDRPTIHLIVGPAGMGKSFLFESLYARLYDDFQAAKRSQELTARPFALLPEHLVDASAATIGSLLDAYLRTEFVRPLERDAFNWKLVNRLGIWLLDGLDEILERDSRFFDDDLMELMTTPYGDWPTIVICVRNSLFATHRGLRDFCDEFREHVVVYELTGWERPSKRALARRELGSATAAARFAESLSEHPALDDLASTPYYCKLLTEEFPSGGLPSEYSERDILRRALERIVEREREKGLLDQVPDKDVREFIESCAAVNLFQGFNGIPVDDVRELAEAGLPNLEDDDEIERLVTQMSQIPVFAFADGYYGRLRFAQEPLEHYLAASYLVQRLESRPDSIREVLGHSDLPDNVVRFIGDSTIASGTRQRVLEAVTERLSEDSVSGRNALRIAVELSAGTDFLTQLQLRGLDLSGLRFKNHGLQGIAFDGADLTNTDFGDSNLTGSSLDGCLVKGTRLPSDTDILKSIRFGGMHRFHSVRVDALFFDEIGPWRAFIEPDLGDTQDEHVCGTASQCRHIIGKFVTETGRGRRKDLPRRAVLRGKRDVADPELILDELIRSGYLFETQSRGRVSRTEDDSYGEMVRFRMDLDVSPGIRAVLDEACGQSACPHVR